MICVSGGFSILHVGHARLFRAAAEYGPLTVILNSDAWIKRKYGYVPVTWEERAEMIMTLRDVDKVVSVDDSDETVCEALESLRPQYFANGGDRKEDNTPELALCKRLGITPLFNIGGDKANSSSWILNAVR